MKLLSPIVSGSVSEFCNFSIREVTFHRETISNALYRSLKLKWSNSVNHDRISTPEKSVQAYRSGRLGW